MPAAPPRPELDDGEPTCLDVLSVAASAGSGAPSTASVGVATTPLQLRDAACQARERADAACEASASAAPAAAAAAGVQRQSGGGVATAAAGDPQLAAFLARVGPAMLDALELAPPALLQRWGGSGAGGGWGGEEPAAALLHTLQAFPEAAAAASARAGKHGASGRATSAPKPLVVTALTWNSTGNTLAAAFGRHAIAGWCSEPGALASWNLARGAAGAAAPDRLLRTDCCLTAAAFHPTEPALLAGGSFNGELLLWDLGRERELDAQAAKSDALGEARHREPVTALAWHFSPAEARRAGSSGGRGHLLLSLGADGRLLVWRAAGGKLDAPIRGFELRCPQPSLHSAATLPAGGTCLAIAGGSSRAPGGPLQLPAAGSGAAGAAFVGTEGGALLRCHLGDPGEDAAAGPQQRTTAAASASAASSGGGEGHLELRNPVKEAGYERAAGAVTGVAASPFLAQAVLASGADGCLRLFHALGRQPVLRVHAPGGAARGVEWSPSAPLVFVACGSDGAVRLYELGAAAGAGPRAPSGGGLLAPAATLQAGSAAAAGRAACAFNRAAPPLLATASGGEVRVWRLPGALAAEGAGADAAQRLARLVQLA
ncbi:hypothetical protein Rsub_13001 [Raphidocelis subcapitata]|uniref:Uncharacterized protein n=1 Tax=Raphidocelis subcapitata TaxID=307507 RepID=A0A2V0PKE8_9CHLO|nr:hypothetical protein Rsub_13001 [Raphidocelis subcapitata]|eukprot:GBG00275.1 hypothetical protein Rsub_13001 [Raphidocelis subcapitata]